MQCFRSSRGAVIAWRQSAEAYTPSTAKPTRHFEARAGRGQVRVAPTLSANGTTSGSMIANGSSTAAFAGMSKAVGSFQATGGSTVSFAGSSRAAGSLLATGSSTVSFVGGSGSNMVPAAGSSSASFIGSSRATATLTPSAGSSSTSFTGSSSSGGGASPASVWNYTLSNGKSAQQTLVELHAMLSELYRIHGLAIGEPLVVDTDQRTAGAITQTITQVDATTVRVERV